MWNHGTEKYINPCVLPNPSSSSFPSTKQSHPGSHRSPQIRSQHVRRKTPQIHLVFCKRCPRVLGTRFLYPSNQSWRNFLRGCREGASESTSCAVRNWALSLRRVQLRPSLSVAGVGDYRYWKEGVGEGWENYSSQMKAWDGVKQGVPRDILRPGVSHSSWFLHSMSLDLFQGFDFLVWIFFMDLSRGDDFGLHCMADLSVQLWYRGIVIREWRSG